MSGLQKELYLNGREIYPICGEGQQRSLQAGALQDLAAFHRI